MSIRKAIYFTLNHELYCSILFTILPLTHQSSRMGQMAELLPKSPLTSEDKIETASYHETDHDFIANALVLFFAHK